MVCCLPQADCLGKSPSMPPFGLTTYTGEKQSDNTSRANQGRITIFVYLPAQGRERVMATALLRWRAVERERLSWELPYVDTTVLCDRETFPKLGSHKLRDFSALWTAFPDRLLHHMDGHGHTDWVSLEPQAATSRPTPMRWTGQSEYCCASGGVNIATWRL